MTEISPVDVVAQKPWWKSKVIWFNAACAALTALEASMHFIQPYIPGNVYGWIILFVTMTNAFLRVITSQAIFKPQINGLFSAPKRPDGGFISMELLPYIVAAFAILGLLYGVYSMGEDAANARWEKVESAKLIAANQKILDLKNQKYDLEQQAIRDAAARNEQSQKELKANEDKWNAVVNKLRAGSIKLRIPTVRTADCGNTTTETAATTTGTQTEVTSELTAGASEFLTGFAKRKDEVTILFNTCVEQLAADRGETIESLTQGDEE